MRRTAICLVLLRSGKVIDVNSLASHDPVRLVKEGITARNIVVRCNDARIRLDRPPRPCNRLFRQIEGQSLPVKLIHTRRFGDDRGWFVETYHRPRWAADGVVDEFVQDNHSYSKLAGTIRGIHFQVPPHAQAKLIRCTRGRIIDYAVDLRAGSPSYGRHVAVELSPETGDQLYIPVGFGHAFVTLEPDTEVMYKASDIYVPACDTGIRWDCPTIAIEWPLPSEGPVLSNKDRTLPTLAEWDSPFAYDGGPLQPL